MGEEGVGEPRLQREGALVEPDVQRLIERHPGLGPLRRVHVEVDEPGQAVAPVGELEQGAGVEFIRRARRGDALVVAGIPRQGHALDEARVVELDQRALEQLEGAVLGGMEQRAEHRPHGRV